LIVGAKLGETRCVSDKSDIAALEASVKREQRKLKALQDVGAALGSTLDLQELLTLVVDRISEAMEADRSTLYVLEEETNELWSKVAQGERWLEIRLRVGDGLAGTVAQTGRTLNIKDAYQDPRFDADWDRRSGYRTMSTVCVPMKNHHGRIIGVVQCLNKSGGAYFTVEDEALLGALASQAAVSIENSKLFLSMVGKNIELLEAQEKLQQKVRELDVLFEIAQVSASAQELDELLEGVLARTMRAVNAEAASILLADADTGDLRFRAAVGGEPEAIKRLRIKAGQGICGWVAQHQHHQVVNDVDADVRHSRNISEEVGYHPRSVLCVPLRWDDGIGAVELLNKAAGSESFTEDDVKLATVIAGHISTAITHGAWARAAGPRAAPEHHRPVPLERAARPEDPHDGHPGLRQAAQQGERRRAPRRVRADHPAPGGPAQHHDQGDPRVRAWRADHLDPQGLPLQVLRGRRRAAAPRARAPWHRAGAQPRGARDGLLRRDQGAARAAQPGAQRGRGHQQSAR
jgi:GAF domain-containing protein